MSGNHEGGGASRSTDPAAGSSAATDVSLREYFNEKIHADRRLNNERFAFAAVIGGVVWFFIERHLTDLNHENARVASIAEGTVSSDTYESDESRRTDERNKLDAWRAHAEENFTKSLTRDEFSRETKTEKRAGVSAGWQALAGVVGLIIVVLAIYAAIRSEPPVVPGPTVTVTVPSK